MATIGNDELEGTEDKWEKLGEGGFGVVYRVFWKTQKKHVAVKKLSTEDFLQEVQMLKRLKHPNIVTLFGFEQTHRMIVMELCELGSLRSFLEQRKDNPLEFPLIFDWMIQASLPIDYLRNHRIEHMDIKTDNYVITSSMVLKLTDFGLSQVLEKTKSCSSQAGSWRWMPPERFNDNKLSPAFHIYSLALIFWCLFTRSIPYAKYVTEYSIANAVAEKRIRPVIPSCCPKPIGELIESCWHHDRTKRPEINVVITTLFQHKSAFTASSQDISTQTTQRSPKTIPTQTEVLKYANVSTQTDVCKVVDVNPPSDKVLPVTELSPAVIVVPSTDRQNKSSGEYAFDLETNISDRVSHTDQVLEDFKANASVKPFPQIFTKLTAHPEDIYAKGLQHHGITACRAKLQSSCGQYQRQQKVVSESALSGSSKQLEKTKATILAITGLSEVKIPDQHTDADHGEDEMSSCRGPLCVSTLLLKYLEEKHKQAMKKIRQKYKVVIECVVDKGQGGQGQVFIIRNEKIGKCSEKELYEAEDEFVSLYQECFQNVTISKPIPCHYIDTQKINKAISYISTQQTSVLVEESKDGEVTFIGLEKEVSEAIRVFQQTTRPKSTIVIQKSSPRRMAAKLGGEEDECEKAETAADNDMEYETHSGIENKDDTENIVENDDARVGDDSCRGPFSVSTLLLKYLEEKHKQAMKKIRQKYKVVIECVVDKSQGGQGKVFIKRNEKMEKCSEAEMDKAEDEFVSLYQKCFQNVKISKPFPCHGLDTQRVNKAISYIWTQQKFVLVEDSIDGEVTFIGLEKEVIKAIRAFQHTTGYHPKTRKLKHSSESSHSSMFTSPFSSSTPQSSSTPRIRYDSSDGSSSGYAGVDAASQFSGQGRRFKTDEGIDVVAKQDDITKQKVDIIVNPSNDELSLGGGVGGALLQAAGRRLQDECDDKRRKLTKKLSEADCVSTKGYGLPSQYVVHVIGPQYPRSTNDRAISVFYSKLQGTFLNCFTEANYLNARSIAIPLVSSGAFGGPKEGCAKALVEALKKYSRMGRNNKFNSVYLVNSDVEAYKAILKALNGLETGSGSEEPMDTDDGMETSQNKRSFWKETLSAGNNIRARGTTEMNLQTGWQNMNATGSQDDSGRKLKTTYNVDNVQITVQQQTILESVKQADGIIVPANSMLDNEIATTIRLEAGINEELMKKTNGFRLSDGEVLHASGNKFGNVKIIFINVPEEKYFSNNRRGLFDKFTDAAYNGLKYADASLRLKEVALLFVPTEGNGPELYCEGLAKAVRRFTDFGVRNIEHVHVVSDNNELNMVLQVTFDDEFKDAEESGSDIGGAHAIVRRGKGVNHTHTHFGSNNYEETMRHERANSRHSEADDIDTSGKKDRPQDDSKDEDSDKEDKRCPICLDNFGDDKPAVGQRKCKHKFCQECLDEFMKRKPVCPVCGVVYGVMKGNQPPGHMSVRQRINLWWESTRL